MNIINNLLDGQVFIQKIYSSAFYVCFNLRSVGVTHQLYFGRGHGYEGAWIAEEPLQSFLRKRDVFLEYLRKHCSGSTFLKLSLDDKDRIVSLHYQKWGRENILSLFYRGRELLFSHYYYDQKKDSMQFFRSWNKQTLSIEDFSYQLFDEVGRQALDKDQSKDITPISRLIKEEEKLALKTSTPKKQRKFLERKIANIEKDLKKVQSRNLMAEFAENQTDLSTLPRKIKIGLGQIKFKEDTHFKRRDEIYQKIKSFKKAEGILLSRLQEAKKLLAQRKDPESMNHLAVNKVYWKQDDNTPKTVSGETNQGIDFYKYKDFALGVGKSAGGNDELRSKWAKKNDYWFHLDGDKSAHLIIKCETKDITQELLALVGSVLLHYSQLNYSQADLIYTQVKNLKGVKKSPGKVIYKKEKRIRVDIISDWNKLVTP